MGLVFGGHVGGGDAFGLQEQLIAFGAVGQHLHALVDAVKGRQFEARQVLLPGLRAVQPGQRLLPIRARGRRAQEPHLQLAGQGGLHVGGPLLDDELQLQSHNGQALLPQLIVLAVDLLWLRGALEHQGRAVGQLAPTVTVAIQVAVHVQQGLGAGGVEVTHLAAELRVIAGGVRQDRRVGLNRLAASNQCNLSPHVVGQADGSAQGDLACGVAADHRVVHVEVGQRVHRTDVAEGLDTALGQVGRQPALGNGQVDEIGRHAAGQAHQPVDLPVQESQPARLVLFDDGHLHLIDQRQTLTGKRSGHGLASGVIGARLGAIEHLAVVGAALEHDLGAADPLLEPERPRADRVFDDLLAIELHHLARLHWKDVGLRQDLDEARVGAFQLEANRVRAQHLQARDWRVVIKGLAMVEHGLPQDGQAEEALVQDAGGKGTVVGRVHRAQDGVGHVESAHLALAALERRVVGKVNTRLQTQRPDPEVVRALQHAVGQHGLEFRRPREMVVAVRCLENM